MPDHLESESKTPAATTSVPATSATKTSATATSLAALEPATVIARAQVARVWRPCPTYARIAFRGAALESFGTPGRTFDQRIKVLFPPRSGTLPELSGAAGGAGGAGGANGADWYTNWLAMPETERGVMRTYSIRELRVDGHDTEVIIDFVLHTSPGSSGPAALWASGATPGDEVLLVGPRRGRFDGGGIEFAPGDASRVLLAGDETAAPAIARILEDAAPDLRGDAFIELPGRGESLSINAPSGVRVHWLGRSDSAPGELLVPRVLSGIGAVPGALRRASAAGPPDAGGVSTQAVSDELVWETPEYSATGEPLEPVESRPASDRVDPAAPGALADRYFWIAGESGVVKRLRRHLVRDLGVHRSRVAFMGYWREGVAMR